jgi:hypothetical protein
MPNIAPVARMQFVDANGNPYSGGKLFTYLAGTSIKQGTYTTKNGGVLNSNPIILDASGRTPYGVWLNDGVINKYVIAPSTDTDPPTSPIYTEDNISGVNDITSSSGTEWVLSTYNPTRTSNTTFTVPSDATLVLHIGRRIKTQNNDLTNTVYSTITNSVYDGTTKTTITVVNDGAGVLQSGLATVYYGILSSTNSSVPKTAMPDGSTATTQTAGDNTTKIATTAYVTTAATAAVTTAATGQSYGFKNLQASATGNSQNVLVSADEIGVYNASALTYPVSYTHLTLPTSP